MKARPNPLAHRAFSSSKGMRDPDSASGWSSAGAGPESQTHGPHRRLRQGVRKRMVPQLHGTHCAILRDGKRPTLYQSRTACGAGWCRGICRVHGGERIARAHHTLGLRSRHAHRQGCAVHRHQDMRRKEWISFDAPQQRRSHSFPRSAAPRRFIHDNERSTLCTRRKPSELAARQQHRRAKGRA